jgi:hypothetical protein
MKKIFVSLLFAALVESASLKKEIMKQLEGTTFNDNSKQ